MTPAECREAVRLMFVELYPHCTVIYSYPNSVRPPLPDVVLDFERIEPVNAFESRTGFFGRKNASAFRFLLNWPPRARRSMLPG